MSRLDRIGNWPELAKLAHFDARNLAKACLVSPSQLRRYFAHAFGMAPKDWLTEIRLSRVTQLLCSSRLSVKDIARELHFASESHLCHQFKRRFGCKPSQFALHYGRHQDEKLTEALTGAESLAPVTLPTPLRETAKTRLAQETRTAAPALQKQHQIPQRRLPG